MQIYLLTDDLADSIFAYVGQTQKPLGARQYEHWQNKFANPVKKNWINYLKLSNHQLKIQAIGQNTEMSYIHGLNESNDWISVNDILERQQSTNHPLIPISGYYRKDNNLFKNYISVPRQSNQQFYWPIFYGKKKEVNLVSIERQHHLEKVLQHLVINPNPESTMKWLHQDNLHYAKEQQSIIRDVLLQYSATLNLFYYDFYSKLIAENINQQWWSLESDFTELWMHGFPLDRNLLATWVRQHLPQNKSPAIWMRINNWLKEHSEYLKKEGGNTQSSILI